MRRQGTKHVAQVVPVSGLLGHDTKDMLAYQCLDRAGVRREDRAPLPKFRLCCGAISPRSFRENDWQELHLQEGKRLVRPASQRLRRIP